MSSVKSVGLVILCRLHRKTTTYGFAPAYPNRRKYAPSFWAVFAAWSLFL